MQSGVGSGLALINEKLCRLQIFFNKLGDIHNPDRFFPAQIFHAERAPHRDGGDALIDDFLGSLQIDPLADGLLHPHSTSAGAAAEALPAVAFQFCEPVFGHGA